MHALDAKELFMSYIKINRLKDFSSNEIEGIDP